MSSPYQQQLLAAFLNNHYHYVQQSMLLGQYAAPTAIPGETPLTIQPPTNNIVDSNDLSGTSNNLTNLQTSSYYNPYLLSQGFPMEVQNPVIPSSSTDEQVGSSSYPGPNNPSSSSQPTTMVAIPDYLYEIYVKPMLMNIQYGCFEKQEDTIQNHSESPSTEYNDEDDGKSIVSQEDIFKMKQPASLFEDVIQETIQPNEERELEEAYILAQTNEFVQQNPISHQGFLESLLQMDGENDIMSFEQQYALEASIANANGSSSSSDTAFAEPTMQQQINNDMMMLMMGSQMTVKDEKEDKPTIPHKTYDPKKNKKGLKKKRKYIKSGLYRKDRDGNFLFSTNDRARLAQFSSKTDGEEDLDSQNESDELNEDEDTTQEDIPATIADLTDEEVQMGFDWYYIEQLPNIQSSQDRASLKSILWAQWELLPHPEKLRCIEQAIIAEQRRQQNEAVTSNIEPSIGTSKSREQIDDLEEDQHNEVSSSNRVKKPLSGYNSFVKAVFPLFQEEHPDIDKKQITKLIGQKWKSMTEQERQPYIEMAKQSQPIVKKPLNAYNIFCKEKYPIFKQENPEIPPNEVSRLVAASWKKATKTEKQKYYEMAEQWRRESVSEAVSSLANDQEPKSKAKKRKTK